MTVAYSVELPDGVTLRMLTGGDVDALLDAYVRNREHLSLTDPARPEVFFTRSEQEMLVAGKLQELMSGTALPLIIVAGDTVIGRMNLTGIIRGPCQSATVGYWLDKDHTGRGLASGALRSLITHSREGLGLHRLDAGTLLHNLGSQKVLRNTGFEPIGVARQFLKIAGTWQDHLLFQRILDE